MDSIIFIVEKFALIVIVVSFIMLIGCGVMLIKNNITYNNLTLILAAIHKYNMAQKFNNGSVDYISYDCMKDYDRALYNLFYWGYKKLVPPEIYKKIRPHIAEVKAEWKTLN